MAAACLCASSALHESYDDLCRYCNFKFEGAITNYEPMDPSTIHEIYKLIEKVKKPKKENFLKKENDITDTLKEMGYDVND